MFDKVSRCKSDENSSAVVESSRRAGTANAIYGREGTTICPAAHPNVWGRRAWPVTAADRAAIGAGSSAGSAHGCCCANLYDVWRTTAGRILATGDAQEKTTSTTATTTTTTTANEGDEDP